MRVVRRFPDMTDLMVQIPADWLARVFLSLRCGSSEDAHVSAVELQPFTGCPGGAAPGPVQYTSL